MSTLQFIASIQQIDADGKFIPLPDEPDIVQVQADSLTELIEHVHYVLATHPDVYDFDLTVTNRANAPDE